MIFSVTPLHTLTGKMDFTHDPFGLHTEHMDTWQMLLRGIVVFFSALILIRIAGIRTLSRQSTFDQLTMLIVGAILGRAVVTGQNFFGILATTLLIVLIHRGLAMITFRSKVLGKVFKGTPIQLVREGRPIPDKMKEGHITEEDLKEALHLRTNSDDLEKIKEAYLERSGHISFIKEKD